MALIMSVLAFIVTIKIYAQQPDYFERQDPHGVPHCYKHTINNMIQENRYTQKYLNLVAKHQQLIEDKKPSRLIKNPVVSWHGVINKDAWGLRFDAAGRAPFYKKMFGVAGYKYGDYYEPDPAGFLTKTSNSQQITQANIITILNQADFAGFAINMHYDTAFTHFSSIIKHGGSYYYLDPALPFVDKTQHETYNCKAEHGGQRAGQYKRIEISNDDTKAARPGGGDCERLYYKGQGLYNHMLSYFIGPTTATQAVVDRIVEMAPGFTYDHTTYHHKVLWMVPIYKMTDQEWLNYMETNFAVIGPLTTWPDEGATTKFLQNQKQIWIGDLLRMKREQWKRDKTAGKGFYGTGGVVNNNEADIGIASTKTCTIPENDPEEWSDSITRRALLAEWRRKRSRTQLETAKECKSQWRRSSMSLFDYDKQNKYFKMNDNFRNVLIVLCVILFVVCIGCIGVCSTLIGYWIRYYYDTLNDKNKCTAISHDV